VVPTSFPATTASASGPVSGMALLRPDLRAQQPVGYRLLAGARQGATACSGDGVPPITADVEGERRPASRSPAQRSGIDGCAAIASLLMNARRHPSEAQPGPKCFVGGDSFVTIASVMVCPGQPVPGMRSLPNVDT
jgi:hypothetical protein